MRWLLPVVVWLAAIAGVLHLAGARTHEFPGLAGVPAPVGVPAAPPDTR